LRQLWQAEERIQFVPNVSRVPRRIRVEIEVAISPQVQFPIYGSTVEPGRVALNDCVFIESSE
jgi:hypothetical protein